MKYKTIGAGLGRNERNDLNTNFQDIDTDIKSLVLSNSSNSTAVAQALTDAANAKSTADAAKVTADGISATASEAKTESVAAAATATEAKTTAETVRDQFDSVVAEAGSNNPEVVQARGSYTNLNQRLDSTAQQLADTEWQLIQAETQIGLAVEGLNLKRDKAVKISEADVETSLKQMIAGTAPVNPNPSDKSIELKQLSETVRDSLDNLVPYFSSAWAQGGILGNGLPSESGTRIRTKDFIKVLPSTLYKLTNYYSIFQLLIIEYDENKNHIINHGWHSDSITNIKTSNNCHYVKLSMSLVSGSVIEPVSLYKSYFNMKIQIEEKLSSLINEPSEVMLKNLSTNTPERMSETFRFVAHKGYSFEAPENTIPAYLLAKEKGFKYIETDVQWTKDGIPVLSHDHTVDRCSNGTGVISEMNLAELKLLDFGSWKNVKYVNTKIPTFQEFVLTAKLLNVHAYVEMKGILTENQVNLLINIVKKLGMQGKITWNSGNFNNLLLATKADAYARISYQMTPSLIEIPYVKRLKTQHNEVIFFVQHTQITEAVEELCRNIGCLIEAWTVDNEGDVLSLMGKGVAGITTNKLIPDDVLASLLL